MESNKSILQWWPTKAIRWMFVFLMSIGGKMPIRAASDIKIPSDIKQSINQRVDNGYNAGIIIGIVNPQGTQYYSYGKTALPDGQSLHKNTIFEIGSITKVFTSLLLADMVKQSQLAFEDPIDKYLPNGIHAPDYNDRSINLVHLATHTSGLPRMPGNMGPINLDNPYADYNVEQVYDFLSNYQLTREVGEKYEYSNYSMGLLGHLLVRHSGLTFEQLIRKRVTDKLGMSNTSITLTPETQNLLANGHRGDTKVANWDFASLEGAGALHSTASDMLTFLSANMNLQDSPLSVAMECTHKPHCKANGENLKIGLGWRILIDDGRHIHWHNGGTGGYFSFIGFDKAAQTGIVILTNSQQSVDDIGFHFFLPDFPLGDYSTSAHVGKAIEVALLPGEKLPTGEYIVKRSIEQVGGHQILAKIQNRFTKATIEMKMFGMSYTGSFIVYQTRLNEYYAKTEIRGLYTVEQGVTNETVWEVNSMTGARVLTGSEKAAMLLAYNFDMTNYKKLYETIACVGKAEIEGQMCYKVVFTPKIGCAPISRYFAMASGVSVKTESMIEQEGTDVFVESWDSNFKPVDGILYPYHSREKAMNIITDIFIKGIEHNVQIPRGQFDLPKSVKKILDSDPNKHKQLN